MHSHSTDPAVAILAVTLWRRRRDRVPARPADSSDRRRGGRHQNPVDLRHDKDGAAVTDLQAADFEIKVGGKVQEVAGVRPAAVPLRIAILVADQGTGAFQLGTRALHADPARTSRVLA